VAAVEVQNLVMRYGDVTAVDGIWFTAQAGQVTAVLGPNGAGKTSTVEALEGFRRPTSGVVRVAGLDPITQHNELVSHIGVMLQDGGVYPSMRAGEAAELFCAYHGNVNEPTELIARVGLGDRTTRTWKQMSGGEQQRLKLALALAGKPDVVFLDEPTAGVDAEGRIVIRDVIRTLAAEGVAVVLTTHELGEAERLADHIVILDRGRLVATGTLAELRGQGEREEIRFAAAAGLDVDSLGSYLGATASEPTPGEYVVRAVPSPDNVARLTGWLAERNLPLADLRAGRQSLEDIFLRLTGNGDA
jgi:ABC-2 type transport system ATP-binding protein